MPHSRPLTRTIPLALLLLLGAAAGGRAEEPQSLLDVFGEGAVAKSAKSGDEHKIDISLTPADAQPGDEVTLTVAVHLPSRGYTYSTNPSFAGHTRFAIGEVVGLEPLGEGFVADQQPKKEYVDVFEQEVEKHVKDVTWQRKYRILPDADLDRVGITGEVRLQICDDRRCLPIKQPIDVALRPRDAAEAAQSASSRVDEKRLTTEEQLRWKNRLQKRHSGLRVHEERLTTEEERLVAAMLQTASSLVHEERPDFQGKPGPATIRLEATPANAKPGEKVTLTASITVEEGYHTYSITMPPGPGGLPTTINVDRLKGLVPVDGQWTWSVEPEDKPLKGDDSRILELHHGTIRWTREFRVTDDATSWGLGGQISYMTCDASRCLPPKSLKFALGDLDGAAKADVTTKGAVRSAAAAPTEFEISDSEAAGGLPWFLLLAFFGGMILNIMPCVLPVLAIKVMSFVQQAGESRQRIFALNAAYAGGVVLVFLILASLAVGIGLGWGGLFQNSNFNLAMACVVFAMGLSLLGVFEIPVPGFVGATAGGQHREGLIGAFLTGILATLLATPCSGPFLGATLGWSVRQSPAIVYLVWATMGLGMAFPYVVFGMFPHAIKWLPKPGNWMVRMKEFAGFVLMGTVIFFIYFLEQAYVVPLLVMLLGIGLALWMIGNLYDVTSHIRHKMAVRIASLSLAALICTFGYSLAGPADNTNRLPWQDFSEARLNASLAENKTVLVDFTADWCLTCKAVEKYSLNTAETKQLVEQHNVVTLYADYTHESDFIKSWLDKFDSESVPLTVIFPGNQPNKPIVIRDVYTKSKLLKRLNEAVGAGVVANDKQASLPSAVQR